MYILNACLSKCFFKAFKSLFKLNFFICFLYLNFIFNIIKFKCLNLNIFLFNVFLKIQSYYLRIFLLVVLLILCFKRMIFRRMIFRFIINSRFLIDYGVILKIFIFDLLFQSLFWFFINKNGLFSIQIVARMWILKYINFMNRKIFVFMHFYRLINSIKRVIFLIFKSILLVFNIILAILNFILILYWYIISKCNIFCFLLQIFKSFSFLMAPSIERLNHVAFWETSIYFYSGLSILRLIIWSDCHVLLRTINLICFSLYMSIYLS